MKPCTMPSLAIEPLGSCSVPSLATDLGAFLDASASSLRFTLLENETNPPHLISMKLKLSIHPLNKRQPQDLASPKGKFALLLSRGLFDLGISSLLGSSQEGLFQSRPYKEGLPECSWHFDEFLNFRQ